MFLFTASYYTAVQKFEISKIFHVFNGVSYAHQGCIYFIKNTEKNSNIVKYYCIFLYWFPILIYFEI